MLVKELKLLILLVFANLHTNHILCNFVVVVKVNFRCDPLINFKLKQKLVMLGACITLGATFASVIHIFSLKYKYIYLSHFYVKFY